MEICSFDKTSPLQIHTKLSTWFGLSEIDCAFSLRSRMYLRASSQIKQIYVYRSTSTSKKECRRVRGKLDQLSCELKHCRYAKQKWEIEVSKRELRKYAAKMIKTGRFPTNAGHLAPLENCVFC